MSVSSSFPSLRAEVLQDWRVNESGKSKVACALVRLGAVGHRRGGLSGRVMQAISLLGASWILGVEIPPQVRVGRELRLFHPVAIVVNPNTVIGDRCTLRNSVTLGNRGGADGDAPVLGNDVELGAGAMVLGGVHVGDGARVGAAAVVLHDVAPGARMVGNPARELSS
jgi:serine acetyltransferase